MDNISDNLNVWASAEEKENWPPASIIWHSQSLIKNIESLFTALFVVIKAYYNIFFLWLISRTLKLCTDDVAFKNIIW